MQATTRKTRILDVVYNASNNELVRTQTLVKSAIVQIDAAPFRQYYAQHYGAEVSSMSQGMSWDHCGDGLCCRLLHACSHMCLSWNWPRAWALLFGKAHRQGLDAICPGSASRGMHESGCIALCRLG